MILYVCRILHGEDLALVWVLTTKSPAASSKRIAGAAIVRCGPRQHGGLVARASHCTCYTGVSTGHPNSPLVNTELEAHSNVLMSQNNHRGRGSVK